jgi:hypothetical protein
MSDRILSPLGRVHAQLRRGADPDRMTEIAKLLGRNSKERWALRQEVRKSDTQWDHDNYLWENGEGEV